MKTIIINGGAGVGKDTFVSLVQAQHPDEVLNYSSVTRIKEIATVAGWDGSKTEKDRKFLSDLKLLCTEYNDLPFRSMEEEIKKAGQRNKAIFLHVREPGEIERAKQAFNAITLFIKRDFVKKVTSNMADANVENYVYDYVINNDGTIDDLAEKAKEFWETVIKEGPKC